MGSGMWLVSETCRSLDRLGSTAGSITPCGVLVSHRRASSLGAPFEPASTSFAKFNCFRAESHPADAKRLRNTDTAGQLFPEGEPHENPDRR